MSSTDTNIFKRYPRVFICVGLSIVMAVIIYFRLQSLPELKETYEQGERELDIILRNQTQGAELSSELNELKRLTAGMQGRLMTPEDKAANSQFFYDIETRSRAIIGDLRQLSTTPGDGVLRPKLNEFTAVGFNLTVSGRIGYVMSFLKRLESGKFFVRCNSLTLKGNATIAPDAVDAVLKLEVLAKKQ